MLAFGDRGRHEVARRHVRKPRSSRPIPISIWPSSLSTDRTRHTSRWATRTWSRRSAGAGARFPFGRKLDIGRDTFSSIAPEITTTAGAISVAESPVTLVNAGSVQSRRQPQSGQQWWTTHRPGRVCRRHHPFKAPRKAPGSASRFRSIRPSRFSSPVVSIKCCPRAGCDLDRYSASTAKGLRCACPEGLSDVSPLRTRIETEGSPSELALRLFDRVATPWTLNRVEQELVGTRAFERAGMTRNESRSSRAESVTVLTGRAVGTIATGADIGMAYAILDLGREKVVARFVGPIEQLAFNESVLRDSLASLEAERLLVGELEPVERIGMVVGVCGRRSASDPGSCRVGSDRGTDAVCSIAEGRCSRGGDRPSGTLPLPCVWRSGPAPSVGIRMRPWPASGRFNAIRFRAHGRSRLRERTGWACPTPLKASLFALEPAFLQLEVLRPKSEGARTHARSSRPGGWERGN